MFKNRNSTITAERNWNRGTVVTIVLAVFILFSTLLSAITFVVVYNTRSVLRGQLETATRQLAAARQQTVRYDFPLQQTFPFSTSIRINETLDVPIDMIVPVRQQITVPVEVPLVGNVELPVTLNFDVPVSTTVSVVLDREIPIETSVDLDTVVPLELQLDQPPLGDVLRELEEALRDLLGQL